jgi:hypothetical protein
LALGKIKEMRFVHQIAFTDPIFWVVVKGGG